MIAVGGDQSFDFRRVYDGEKNELKGVLAYPNTLCPINDLHSYVGHDGIYFFGQYYVAPDRPEWLHRASAVLMQRIDSNACDAHVATAYGDEVLYSVATDQATNHCPDYTLRINKKYEVADVVDDGFLVFEQFSPMDVPTIRDFIVENEICSLAGLASAGFPYGTQELPRVLPSGSAPFTPDHIYTNVPLEYTTGSHVEDYTQPNSSVHSLCALLGSERLDEICRTCKVPPKLIAASSVDWCIKELGEVFYREQCQNFSATGTTDSNGYTAAIGSYLLQPITSIIRFAPAFAEDSQVCMEKIELKFVPQPQDDPLDVVLRVGISSEPADPNTGEGIVFFQHSGKPIKYNTAKDQAQHLADGTVPDGRALWQLWREGRFLYIELSITGVGGDALFSKLNVGIKASARSKNC